MAISKDSDDMVDPGQADAPDLDAWRAEAGAALALTARAPSNIVEVIAEGGDPDVPISADEEAALPTAEQREAACGWVASARTGWPRDAARVAVLVDMLDRARAVLDALPHCLGTWVKGSGGHCVYANDCRKIATVYEDGADGYNFCDEHGARNILDKFREEYLWADAVRALDAAGAKEPSR